MSIKIYIYSRAFCYITCHCTLPFNSTYSFQILIIISFNSCLKKSPERGIMMLHSKDDKNSASDFYLESILEFYLR